MNTLPKYRFLDLAEVNAPYAAKLREAACRVIDSGRYIGGHEIEQFERKLSAIFRAPHCIGVSNGLDALRLSLMALIISGRLSEGDEVLVPANTFIASFLAISHCRLRPVPIDPEPDTMVISGRSIANAVTSRTKAIMTVHLYGRIAWDDEMAEIVRRHNLLVIEDAAQAIGAVSPTPGLFLSNRAAAIGHIGAISFYPTKNVGALGDAGAVVTHDAQLAEIVRQLANYGSAERNEYIHKGFNCRLDPIQAAMLSVKLDYLRSENAERFARATAYNNTISSPHVITPPISNSPTDCVWHQYVIRTPLRNQLRSFLLENGVETDIHYPIPPHRQPAFSELSSYHLPVTERLADQILSLPISPGCISVKDASDIARIINQFK